MRFDGLHDAVPRDFRQPRARNHLVDHSQFQCAFRGQNLPGQNHIERFGNSHQPRQTGAAAPGGKDAEQNLRQTDFRHALGGCDAILASQRKFITATHASAVDRGNNRDGHRRETIEDALPKLHKLGQEGTRVTGPSRSGSWRRRRQLCHAGQCMNVGASYENVFLRARNDDAAQVGDVFDSVEMRIQFEQRGAIENVRG